MRLARWGAAGFCIGVGSGLTVWGGHLVTSSGLDMKSVVLLFLGTGNVIAGVAAWWWLRRTTP